MRERTIPLSGLTLVALAAFGASAAFAVPMDELRGSLPIALAGAGATPDLRAVFALPPVALRSALRIVHLMGLCLGFGTALLLDISSLSWLRRRAVPPGAAEFVRRGEQLVLTGFLLLWASGIALTILAVRADPAFLSNGKLWAKIFIVLALTANAVVLHLRVLPIFSASLGRTIDGRWRGRERTLFILCGAISAASWSMAMCLGVLGEWNHVAGIAPILGLWLVCLCLAAAAIQLLFPKPELGTAFAGSERRGVAAARLQDAATRRVPVWTGSGVAVPAGAARSIDGPLVERAAACEPADWPSRVNDLQAENDRLRKVVEGLSLDMRLLAETSQAAADFAERTLRSGRD